MPTVPLFPDATAGGQCCAFNMATGEPCPAPATHWVGSNGVDDYTHVCGDHVEDVKRDGDTVYRFQRSAQPAAV